MADRDVEEAAIAAEETGCNVDIDVAKEEATWYSIMNVLALSLGSGLGIPMADEEIEQVMENVGGFKFHNPLLLKAFYKSADPHLKRPFQAQDLDTWRWATETFDQNLVPQAQGWSIIAQTECAKWFELPVSAGLVDDVMRGEWRANSMLLAKLARKQCEFAFDNLRNDQGFFAQAAESASIRFSQEATNLEDQACMLWAVSDAAILADRSDVSGDEVACRKLIGMADRLFTAIRDHKDLLLEASQNQVLARSTAIPALAWYACATDTQDLRARCLWLLREFADSLVKARDSNEMVGDTLIDAAAALRALTEAFRVTGLRTYAESASRIFDFMETQWWKRSGLYAPTPQSPEYTFNSDDIGIVLGALNAGRLFLKERIDGPLAELRMRVFLCKAVNMSGFMMSMPSSDFLPEWLQQREPDSHFRHGAIPLPSRAGGEFGIAPVFAGEVGYDPQSDTWSRRMLFDTPSAMRASCELIWLNRDAVNGFPDVKLEEAPIVVRRAAGVEAE